MSKQHLLYLHIALGGVLTLLIYLHLISNDVVTGQATAYPLQGKSFPISALALQSVGLDTRAQQPPPVICNVQIVDLNQDGRNEVLITDAQAHALLLGQFKNGQWQETVIAEQLQAPARVEVCDFDQDGDLDILIAELGDVFPNDQLIGSVILLRNDQGSYTRETLIDGLGRVADVRCGDFNKDGRNDLAVAVFGHGHGQVLQFIQQPSGHFERRTVLEGPGSIHVPVADFNNDGHLDMACVLSQEEEEVWVCLNDGSGNLRPHCIFKSMNPDFGSSGLVAVDIDQDGDMDLLLPHGDNLEEFFHYPQAYHGCVLLVNNGDGSFNAQRISDLPGCYAAAVGDMNANGNLDVILLSMVNDWRRPDSASVLMLEHDGELGFVPRQIASQPIGLITCDIGDINHDGVNDIITGSFRIQPPFDRASRLHAWLGQAP